MVAVEVQRDECSSLPDNVTLRRISRRLPSAIPDQCRARWSSCQHIRGQLPTTHCRLRPNVGDVSIAHRTGVSTRNVLVPSVEEVKEVFGVLWQTAGFGKSRLGRSNHCDPYRTKRAKTFPHAYSSAVTGVSSAWHGFLPGHTKSEGGQRKFGTNYW